MNGDGRGRDLTAASAVTGLISMYLMAASVSRSPSWPWPSSMRVAARGVLSGCALAAAAGAASHCWTRARTGGMAKAPTQATASTARTTRPRRLERGLEATVDMGSTVRVYVKTLGRGSPEPQPGELRRRWRLAHR